jgi:transposase
MNESPRPPAPPSAEALFRYSILAQLEGLLPGGSRAAAAVREVAARPHAHPAGHAARVSARTIQRWHAAYQASGIAGLEPKSRQRTQTSVVLEETLIAFFRTEKEADPRASVPELIRRARERGILHGPIDRTTAWGACRRMGLATRPRPTKRERTVSIGQNLASDLLVLADGKDSDAPVFSIAYRDLDYKWKAARGRAGLEHVSFKDLRTQISQDGEEAGIPLTVLTRGHAEAIEGAMSLVSLQSGLQSEKPSIAVTPCTTKASPLRGRPCFVPGAGLEPARGIRPNGFYVPLQLSLPYQFAGLDHAFTISLRT